MKGSAKVAVLLLILLMCMPMMPVGAQETATEKIQAYIRNNGLMLQPGTTRYQVFMKDILWGEHPALRDPLVLAYATDMVGQMNGREHLNVNGLSESPGLAAIGPRASSYDRSRAVAYAYTWSQAGGRTRNPAYPYFDGNDCTNFISQVVASGGVRLVGTGACGSASTNTEWYANKASWWCPKSFAWTAAWVNVYDFWHYQTQTTRNATYQTYRDYEFDQLRKDAWQGDVIQLQSIDRGVKWHSMVVTRKDAEEIYLTYHSGPGGLDVVDRPLRLLRDPEVRYWLLRF